MKTPADRRDSPSLPSRASKAQRVHQPNNEIGDGDTDSAVGAARRADRTLRAAQLGNQDTEGGIREANEATQKGETRRKAPYDDSNRSVLSAESPDFRVVHESRAQLLPATGVRPVRQRSADELEANDTGDRVKCPVCHLGMDHWKQARRQQVNVKTVVMSSSV